jgi:hypothetical protein
MLVCLIPLFSCGEFVPVIDRNHSLLLAVNQTILEHVVHDVRAVMALYHDPAVPNSVRARHALCRALTLVSSEMVFVELDSVNSSDLTQGRPVSAPHLFFFLNGSIWAHYPFPAGETVLLRLLAFLSSGPSADITTRQSLYEHLGRSPFSLVHPGNFTHPAFKLHRFASSHLGFIDLVPFSVRHADNLSLNPSQSYLYRLDDSALEPIEPSIAGLVDHIDSVFHRLTPRDIVSGALVFGIAVNDTSPFVFNVLESIALKFPNLTVGLIESSLHGFANLSVGGSLIEIPSFALFNATTGQYTPIPADLNNMLRNENPETVAAVEGFLLNPPPEELISEPIPEVPTLRLVGQNHDEFVNNDAYDAVVLYFSQQENDVDRAIKLIEKAAEKFKKDGSIQFRMINVTTNSGTFPQVVEMPHIEIFPAADKEDHRTFFGRYSFDNLIRFIQRYGSAKIDLDVPPMTKAEASFETYRIFKVIRELQGVSRAKAEERLSELGQTQQRL